MNNLSLVMCYFKWWHIKKWKKKIHDLICIEFDMCVFRIELGSNKKTDKTDTKMFDLHHRGRLSLQANANRAHLIYLHSFIVSLFILLSSFPCVSLVLPLKTIEEIQGKDLGEKNGREEARSCLLSMISIVGDLWRLRSCQLEKCSGSYFKEFVIVDRQ